MKIAKLYTVLAAAAVMLGVASCDTPDTPVMNKPTEFKLNTPPFAQQFYALSEGATLEFTCSQPDYGIGTAVHYTMEASLTEDFSANVFPLANINNSANISISATDLNLAICEALGVVDDDTWAAIADNTVMPVYFRAIAQVGQVEWSRVVSNTVTIPRVQVYYALKMPAYIYLVGSPSGWVEPSEGNAEHYRDWRLYEADDAIGSNVYSAVFEDMPANPAFRFYTALNGWEKDFIGATGGPNDDKDVDVDFTNGVYEGTLTATKDKFHFANFEGGAMTITVDLNKMTVKIQAGAQAVVTTKYAYMVGNQAGWAEPSEANLAKYEDWMLVCDNAEGLYKGIFTIPGTLGDEGNLYCRFYTELTGWGAAQWASVTGDNYPVTPGVAVPTAEGEGCFVFEGVAGETISVVIDSKNNTVTFDFAQEDLPKIYMVGNQAGWTEPSEANLAKYEGWALVCDNNKGIYKATFAIPADLADGGTLYCRFYNALNGWGAAQWASVTGDNYPVTPGVAAPTAQGEGCFVLEGAAGQNVSVVVDTQANTATFNFVASAQEI